MPLEYVWLKIIFVCFSNLKQLEFHEKLQGKNRIMGVIYILSVLFTHAIGQLFPSCGYDNSGTCAAMQWVNQPPPDASIPHGYWFMPWLLQLDAANDPGKVGDAQVFGPSNPQKDLAVTPDTIQRIETVDKSPLSLLLFLCNSFKIHK